MIAPDNTEALVAGVDIGGTNTRIALATVQEPGRIVARDAFVTPAGAGPDETMRLLAERLFECLERAGIPRSRLEALGCTVPGVTDPVTGTALFVSNLTGWDGYPVADRLAHVTGLPVTVENDVNAAAYGEYVLGGTDRHSVVYLTVSTGVAAGIVIEGRVLRGFQHAAGELGFFVPDPHYLDRDWHPNGCLELTSAGIGLAGQWATLRGTPVGDTSAREVFIAAEAGDPQAQVLVTQAADYLAQAAVAVCTILDPECLILGGSIAEHQPRIVHRIRQVLDTILPHTPQITLSRFGGDAPIVGTLALARDRCLLHADKKTP